MRFNRRHKALFFCIILNLVVFLYLFLSQHGDLNGVTVKPFDVKELEFTVLIYEFEEFENDVKDTAQSILNVLPNTQIIVFSDKIPYPPLDVTHDKVKVVVKDQPLTNPKGWGDPSNYIKTKYVLIVPDAVRLLHTEKIKNLDYNVLESTYGTRIIAFPVDKKYYCSELKVDLRRWTMSYADKTRMGNHICDAVTGNTPIALLIPTTYLNNLTEPFVRPNPEGLFVQFSLHGWKTFVFEEVFTRGKNLFINDHKRWKVEQKRKERQVNFYKRFGIKLVNQNGVNKWYGCQKDTPRCFGTVVDDMPEYIYNGRWTPPCCMRNLKETTRYVFQTLVNSGVKYWLEIRDAYMDVCSPQLEGGSLLGAVRYSDIIPWDYDVDIGIYQHEIAKCAQLKKVLGSPENRFVDEKDFVWEKASEGEFYRVQFSQINHLHVDIFPFYERNGVMTKNTWFKTHRQDAEFPAHYLKPLSTIDFIGIKASVPNNYREFLELKFGKGVIENPQFPNPQKAKGINV